MTNQKLLIIDDSPDIHELVTIWLAEEPLDFFSCATGGEGAQEAACLSPDLILLDVDLPDIDGFEVCRRLKANPVTASIPIVFLTGASATDEKLRGLELGATDYVTKPFDPAELRARVRSALQTRRLMELLEEKAAVLRESEERFRILAENSSDVISRRTPEGVFLYISPASKTILGYEPQQLVGRNINEFVHPDDAQAMASQWTLANLMANSGTSALRFRRADGQYIWVESTRRPLLDPVTGAFREIHACTRDITARKQMEAREQVRVDVLEMITDGLPLNDIMLRLTGAAEQQEPRAIAAGIMLSGSIVHHCAPNLPAPLSTSIEPLMYHLVARFGALAALSSERTFICDLTTDPAWESLRPVIAQTPVKFCWSILILSRHRDITGAFSIYTKDSRPPGPAAVELMKLASDLMSVAVEHRQLTDKLTFAARHDTLTGLPNRAMFADRLEHTLATASRGNRLGAVIVVDVDRFKHVNDTYGHQAGDQLLCEVARRLQRRLRKSDTLARMGGDEFAIILGEIAAPDDVAIVTRSLLEEFASAIHLSEMDLFVSVSLGASVFPQDGTDSSTLLKNADFALYQAKNSGRNTFRVFTPDMSDGADERLELEADLRLAVPHGQLRLHYQPLVDCDGNIVALEALVRWQHPLLGMVPPAKFIPLAEDSGLILPIGNWVLQEAARQQSQWIAAGIKAIPIAVNISLLQFSQPDFLSTISSVLNCPGLPEKWLRIELTESLLMRNMCDAVDKLSRLREWQVEVAIDDFGTGYSSLAYLQRLSIDTLKIDHSFIHSIGSGHSAVGAQTITAAIISMAKSLGLKVVAEGVENHVQRDFLLDLQCDLMQGFLFQRPQPASALQPLLLTRRIPPPNTMAIPA